MRIRNVIITDSLGEPSKSSCMQIQINALGVAGLLALAPAAAFAVDYMNLEQAAQLFFPQADRFSDQEWALDVDALQQLSAMGVKPRSTRWTLRRAWQGKTLLGVVVGDAVLGKFELISYAVGIDAEGKLIGVEVLSYRESHGQEVRMPAWRKQFVGKTAAAPLKVGEDVANISGATLSCTHLTEGIRRVVNVVELARKRGQLG